jgi:hypothetical protein
LIADLSGRIEAVDDVDEVRFRARGVDDESDPGLAGADEESDRVVGLNIEEVSEIDEEVEETDIDDTFGAGKDGLARAPVPVPPVAVLPLATEDTERPLTADATERTERAECTEALDVARSRCSADMFEDTDDSTDPGTGTEVVPPLVALVPWRDAAERREDMETVFGSPEEVRDWGRGTALAGAEPPEPREKSTGNGGNAFDTGLNPGPSGRIPRDVGSMCPCASSSLVKLPTGALDL